MNKQGQEMARKWKEKAVQALEFPEELVMPRIVMTGNKSVIVENYKAIIEYESDSIRINTPGFLLQMKGRDFEILAISDDCVQISGTVCQMEFLY